MAVLKCTYTTTVVGRCPVTGVSDVYTLTVHARRMVPVEEIIEASRVATELPVYQEAITAAIRAHLGARRIISVETVGAHSGVETRVEVS